MNSLNKKNLFLYLLIISFAFSSCNKKETPSIMPIEKVEAIKVKKDVLKESLKNLGNFTYKSKHNVSSLVSGRLETLYVKEGDYVKKGEILAELKNLQLENQREMYENNLIEAESSLKISEDNLRLEKLNIEKQIKSLDKLEIQIKQEKANYEHRENCYLNDIELNKVGGLSDIKIKEEELNLMQIKSSLELLEKEYEISSIGFRDCDITSMGYEIPENKEKREKLLIEVNAKHSEKLVETEKSRVENAKKNLENICVLMEELKIKANVPGIIGSSNFQNGDHINENETCFVIIDTSSVNAVFYVQEQEIWKYKINDSVEITIPSLNEKVNSSISEISPVADPTSGNFCVKANIKNKKNFYKPGMFISCSLPVNEEKNYLLIPESSIIYQKNSEPGIFNIKGNHVFFRNIKIHCIKDGTAYVNEGIKEDDVIVNKPSVFLREGEAVEVL